MGNVLRRKRRAIVLSCLWMGGWWLFFFLFIGRSLAGDDARLFFLVAVAPVAVLWGLAWARAGFRKKPSHRE